MLRWRFGSIPNKLKRDFRNSPFFLCSAKRDFCDCPVFPHAAERDNRVCPFLPRDFKRDIYVCPVFRSEAKRDFCVCPFLRSDDKRDMRVCSFMRSSGKRDNCVCPFLICLGAFPIGPRQSHFCRGPKVFPRAGLETPPQASHRPIAAFAAADGEAQHCLRKPSPCGGEFIPC